MAFNHFDYVPSSISKNRSIFKFDKAIATAGEIGFLYPMCKPVRMYPGSSLKLDLAMEVRSGALIAPLMDELQVDCYAFNVPNRIVWEHWKQFLGATDDVLFDNLSEYKIPHFQYCGLAYDEGLNKAFVWSHLLAAHFELPYMEYRTPYVGEAYTGDKFEISALPFRGYNFIWNEFFRPEQIVTPVLFSKTDAGYSGDNMTYGETGITFNGVSNGYYYIYGVTNASDVPISGGVVLPTYRVHKSLWTSCLPKPSLETLNLLGDLQAPVGIMPTVSGTTSSQTTTPSGSDAVVADKFFGMDRKYTVSGTAYSDPIYADLSQAILTVNNYRETIMLQNYYNALNASGSRYDELLRTLFHTTTPEAIIDIPELIVHKRFTIYRKLVVANATTDYGDGNIQMLGSQAAYIDTVVRDSFFTKSTNEHGYIHLLWTIRPSRIRMQNGFEPEWMQLDKFQQYYSCFDGMGDVPRKKMEVMVHPTGTITTLETEGILGYQEYGAEDKYQRSSSIGWLNEYTDNPITGLTTAEKLSAQPALIVNWSDVSYLSCIVEEEAFARCLAISSPMVAPQFILDIRLNGEIVHPMPVYNIPGMGDLL